MNKIPTKPQSDQFQASGIKTTYAELTLEADAIALQAVHSLSEEVFPCGRHSRDIMLVPLNGSVDVFENLLDGVSNFGSNPIARNQGDLCHIES